MSEEVITKDKEPTVEVEQKDNSTIRSMREAIKERDKTIAELEKKMPDIEATNKKLEQLENAVLTNKYGAGNLEKAKKLINADFTEDEIKQMLKATDVEEINVSATDEELGLTKKGDEVSKKEEAPKPETNLLDEIEKDNKRHSGY